MQHGLSAGNERSVDAGVERGEPASVFHGKRQQDVVGQMLGPGQLGVEPLLAFPAAVLLMTFLSFFIGTFLQLMWEDLPITEPL